MGERSLRKLKTWCIKPRHVLSKHVLLYTQHLMLIHKATEIDINILTHREYRCYIRVIKDEDKKFLINLNGCIVHEKKLKYEGELIYHSRMVSITTQLTLSWVVTSVTCSPHFHNNYIYFASNSNCSLHMYMYFMPNLFVIADQYTYYRGMGH